MQSSRKRVDQKLLLPVSKDGCYQQLLAIITSWQLSKAGNYQKLAIIKNCYYQFQYQDMCCSAHKSGSKCVMKLALIIYLSKHRLHCCATAFTSNHRLLAVPEGQSRTAFSSSAAANYSSWTYAAGHIRRRTGHGLISYTAMNMITIS